VKENILKLLSAELERKNVEDSIIKWIDVNDIKNEKFQPITFDKHPFLVDIYLDFSTNQVQVKCAQVGLSTSAILKELYLAKNNNYNTIHTLPTADFSNEFVKSKVDPIIKANNRVFNVTKKTDSARHKELGIAHLFYRGTFTETEGISISSDVLVNDEYDRSNLSVIDTFTSRLDYSDYKRIWKFSNPTIPEFGIDALYKGSKQYHWFIKCSHCGEWQFMVWPDSIDFKMRIFVCVKCKKEITDEDRLNGQWIAKYKNRETNGYWLSQLFCVWHNAAKIINDYQTKKRDVFFNFTLGMPYEGSDVNVKSEHIMRCLSSNIAKPGVKAMGIDQGSIFYIVCGGVSGIERIYTVNNWDAVREEILKFSPDICVIDGLPETNKVKDLQKEFGENRIYPAFYKDKPEDPRTVRWERRTTDKSATAVYIDRFRSIDNLISKIVANKITIFTEINNPNVEILIKHFESLYRTEETNRVGQTFYVWKSSSRQDHFVHAMNYWVVALDRIYHLDRLDSELDENKRPYRQWETPEERLERLDDEYMNQDYPEYLKKRRDMYLRRNTLTIDSD